MEPQQPAKRRRLAPKPEEALDEQAPDARPLEYPHEPDMHDEAAPPPPPEYVDYATLARHLQDAASRANLQSNSLHYNSVLVLLLRWDGDHGAESHVAALEKVFNDCYRFRTERCNIPTGPNPSAKLLMEIGKHLAYCQSDCLVILYYAGYGYVAVDQQLYWACNDREDAARVKWDGVRCLIEDAPSDMLLLLDSCAVPASPAAGCNGVKQGIAAYGHSMPAVGEPRPNFTDALVESFWKLSGGPTFNASNLYDEIVAQRREQHQTAENGSLTNGGVESSNGSDMKVPLSFTLTPDQPRNIIIVPQPVPPPMHLNNSPGGDSKRPMTANGESAVSPRHFQETMALVNFTFHGDLRDELANFKRWLAATPAMSSTVAVEAMFEGSSSLLLVSMPIQMLNSMSTDGLWQVLGYTNSHNLAGEYHRFSGPLTKATPSQMEDGRILLEAAGAINYSPPVARHEHSPHGHAAPTAPMGYPHLSAAGVPAQLPLERKDDAEDSVEMHEAAEQLKALSHMHHVGKDAGSKNEKKTAPMLTKASPIPHNAHDDDGSSVGGNDSALDDAPYASDFAPPASRPKSRRSNQKQGTKQDTRCALCSVEPFKDSSSLRKHVASAHTRPFPCAFSFAGCTSTFGSKNEWKRHISSQHLGLSIYRCSACTGSTVEGKTNEFNRKDLFTQHLRRMHAPFQVKKHIAKPDAKVYQEWEVKVKEMQASCLVVRREPPLRSACPKADCSNVFEGPGSWDDWTEHVGRHMEKGEANRLGIDRLLAQWALEEGIIEQKEDGGYRLCGGTEREPGTVGGGSSGGPYFDEESSMGHEMKLDPRITGAEEGKLVGNDDSMVMDEGVRISDSSR